MNRRRHANRWGLVACALATALALTAAGCGGGSEEAATTASPEETQAATTGAETAAPAETGAPADTGAGETAAVSGEALGEGDCGYLPFTAPGKDEEGVYDSFVSTLPQEIADGYNSYTALLANSPYADFAPDDGPPWTVGYSDSFQGNAWRQSALAALKQDFAAAKELGLVEGELIVFDSNLKNDVQIQQMRSLIQQDVDIILSIPNSPTAMNGVIKEAFDAGIPVLTVSAPVDTPYAVNIDTNQFVYGARQAQGLGWLLGGEGEIMTVQGIPGTPGSQGIQAGGDAIFEGCPNLEIVADFAGSWNNATAKTEMLKALATYTGELDGVWEQGSMEKGIIEALEQSGREVPTVTMGNPDQAGLAYWRDHVADGYQGVATAQPSGAGADAMFRVAMRILEGKGLKVNAIVGNPPLTVNDDKAEAAQAAFPSAPVQTLSEWVKPDWTFDSPGVANPACGGDGVWLNNETLDYFFNEPGTSFEAPAPEECAGQ